MKQYKYRGHDEPIIQHDDGTLTYRGHEIMKFCSNQQTPRHLIRQHYEGEMDIVDRIIQEEEKPKKEYRYEDTADYGMELFWKYVEG